MIIYNLNTNEVKLGKDEYGRVSVDGRIIDAINSAAERLGYSKQLTAMNRNTILRYITFWGEYCASIDGFLDMDLKHARRRGRLLASRALQKNSTDRVHLSLRSLRPAAATVL